jgi:hypothetical protein
VTDLAQHVCDLLADNKRLQAELARVTAELKEANEALTVAYMAGAERGKDSASERGRRACRAGGGRDARRRGDTMKLCQDCKHFFVEGVSPLTEPRCHAPQNEDTPDLVTKRTNKKWRWPFCETHRADGWFAARMDKTCGREGRWFERSVML